jgi:hypothetical protein
MIVALVAMRMVEMPVHEVVHMVAMGYLGMTTTGAVDMISIVPAALVARRATLGIHRRYFEHAIIHVVAVDMVQMTVVEVVGVTIVLSCRMARQSTKNGLFLSLLPVPPLRDSI